MGLNLSRFEDVAASRNILLLLLLVCLYESCAASQIPKRIDTSFRQAVGRSFSPGIAALLPFLRPSLGSASPVAVDSASIGIDVNKLRDTVNGGRVSIHDDFISKELLDELRADLQIAKKKGAFQPSGLSNRASVQNLFDGKSDRLVCSVLGTSYSSVALLKVKSKLDDLRSNLAISLDRPTIADDSLPHELYYSSSTKGAFLKRHMDERHEELKGRKGYTLPSRRSLSFLVYLSDDNWSDEVNGGQLRTYPQAADTINAKFGGEHEGCLQVAWLTCTSTESRYGTNTSQPIYLDSFSRSLSVGNKEKGAGLKQDSQNSMPHCQLYIVNSAGDQSGKSQSQSKSQKRVPITGLFEIRDPSTGDFEEKWERHLLPSFNNTDNDNEHTNYSIAKLEDLKAWEAGQDPANSVKEDISPVAGRLVVFDSVMLPHQVLETKRGERAALAGWFHSQQPGIPFWVGT